MKTFSAKPHEVKREWFVIDATDKVLGRVASEVAHRLRGKHKPEFTPHVDTGDFIVVINAAKLRVTGRKLKDKIYYRHSEYPGGLRATAAGKLLDERPERMVREAIAGMLPKNRLGKRLITKLKIYAGAEHPHAAQKPEPLKF